MKKDFIEEDLDIFEEENVYSGESREHMLEDGELSPEEEGFMQGYDLAG